MFTPVPGVKPAPSEVPPMAKKKLLDRTQVCKLCDISDTTLYRWLDLGVFPRPSHKAGHFVRWRAEDIQAWMDRGCADPGQPQPWAEYLKNREREEQEDGGGK
jgi:predicted DNA-binding transcriptional regulator AlpA